MGFKQGVTPVPAVTYNEIASEKLEYVISLSRSAGKLQPPF